mgnify:CR=1 FL=1
MATTKIKKGDTVRVIAGKDKGTEGKVISVDMKKHKVVVEGVGMVTKHAKPSAANQNGGIIQKEAPMTGQTLCMFTKADPQELVSGLRTTRKCALRSQQEK